MNKIKGSGYYSPWTSRYQGCYGYWLATSYPGTTGNAYGINIYGKTFAGSCSSSDLGILPIVILPQDVQLEKNSNGVWEVVIPETNND